MVLILTMRNWKLISWWCVHFAIIFFFSLLRLQQFIPWPSLPVPAPLWLDRQDVLHRDRPLQLFDLHPAPPPHLQVPQHPITPPHYLLLQPSAHHSVNSWANKNPTPTFPFMSSSPRPHQLYNTLFFHESSFSYAPQWDWVGDNHIFKQLFVQLPHAGPI